MALDPIDYAVISQALQAAADEAGAKLIRSAYTPILREARDGSAAILDARGNVIAQADLIPMQLGGISATCKPCLEAHPPETLKPGDFLINNDPFQGGQHLQDIFIFTPVFHDGRVIAFAASVAHHLDLGGGAPGLNMEAPDVYAEGLRLPPSKWNWAEDWNSGRLEALMRLNVRVPDLTMGDMNAQFAANAIAENRLQQLAAKYGAAKVEAAMGELLDYAERRVRAGIAAAPDGVYHGQAAMDDDGVGQEPVWIRCTVTIAGDSLTVDFDGTDPQVATNINCPFASTLATALSCVKSVLTAPDIPFNEGVKRPITVTAPFGSILNPRPPAPVRARLLPAYRAYNAVMDALSKAVPDLVIAPGFDATTSFCLSHLGEAGYSVYLEIFGGGYGGGKGSDGCDAVDSPLSNCSNTPVEALDADYDFFRVVDYALAPDSFGDGEHRGGAGFRRRYRILKDGAKLQTYSDRHRLAPAGLFGGGSGQAGRTVLYRDGEARVLPPKASLTFRAGDEIEIAPGGGGGYGLPAKRQPQAREDDLANGLATPGTQRAAAE
ncbi:MAG: hydantoinase B/oxoprolinase family protein [Alphaproteobacteria bacterium]|nr:hydantoinase B/oxoprolinase family protein [Alphaproteobacteria bacterium]MCB9928834.1 hydantoinase B/oxoprolinase family protein [Alphaproteobacteria bacterium]